MVSKDEPEIKQLAAEMIANPGDMPIEIAKSALKCIETATGVVHTYNRSAKTFTTWGTVADREEKKAAAQEEAKRAAEEARRSEEERDAIVSEVARSRADRTQAVQSRLFQACGRLYSDNPDTTITNRLCYDVFMATGLPE